jgi:hypothetical protein
VTEQSTTHGGDWGWFFLIWVAQALILGPACSFYGLMVLGVGFVTPDSVVTSLLTKAYGVGVLVGIPIVGLAWLLTPVLWKADRRRLAMTLPFWCAAPMLIVTVLFFFV